MGQNTTRRAFIGVVLCATTAICGAACERTAIQNNASSGAAIGPNGGIVPGPDGAELRVPGGALSQSTSFTISLAAAGSYPAPPTTYDLGGNHIYAFEPHGQKFLSPATVSIPFLRKPVDPVLLRAENGDTTWRELAVSGSSANALEAAVSSLSYFVVADKHLASGEAKGCSGRTAAGGKSNGTVSSTSTVTIGQGSFDLSKAVSGYAAPVQSVGYALVFADHANACGYNANADYKVGGNFLRIELTTSSPTVTTYGPTEVGAVVNSVPAGVAPGTAVGSTPGQCSVDNYGSGPSSGPGVTITAIDATHVSGSFDMVVQGSQLSGTFDLPICPPDASLNAVGFVDNHCCVQ